MSGRIRTIKPEWLEDEKLCFASADARLLSIALILLADDHGNGRSNPVWLNSQVFPGEPDMGRAGRALDELVGIGFARRYEVAGQSYFAVRGWSKHQRIDRPSKPRVPLPPPEAEPREVAELPREPSTHPREGSQQSSECVDVPPNPQETPHKPTLDTSSRALDTNSWSLATDQGPRTSDRGSGPVPTTTTTTDARGADGDVGQRPHKLTPAFTIPEDDWCVIASAGIPDPCKPILIRWYVNHHLDGDSRTPAEWRRAFRRWASRAWNERRKECVAESKLATEPVELTPDPPRHRTAADVLAEMG